MNIAIVGLGRVGSHFLSKMIKQAERGIVIAAVAEQFETPAKTAARAAGLTLKTAEEIADAGPSIDVIFDTTGNDDVRRMLRDRLRANGNEHTVIAPETVTRLIWQLVSDGELPDVHARTGY